MNVHHPDSDYDWTKDDDTEPDMDMDLDDDETDEFDWSSADDFYPKIHGFSAVSGVKVDVEPTPLAIFKLFFTNTLMEMITRETNRYAEGLFETAGKHTRKWKATTMDEIFVFFSVVVLMGIYPKPDVKTFWTTEAMLETPFFHDMMPRDRFLQILRALHFFNNDDLERGNEDLLYKLRPVVDTLNDRFQSIYTPKQNICVDESLWRYRGRLSFRQYNPSKRARFGVKVFKLCQSTGPGAGYTHRFSIYTGKLKGLVPISEKVVMTLASHLLDQGYNLFLDNWFSSPSLFRKLFNRKTNVTGTVRLNRRNMPPNMKTKPKLKKGETLAASSGDMLALVWKDKKNVNMLTTMHKDTIRDTGKKSRTGKAVRKPIACSSYSKGMGGVDLNDQISVFYKSPRKTIKWYKKIFFYMLDMTIVNSFVVWKVLNGDESKSYLQFRLDLIREILDTVERPTYSGRGRTTCKAPLNRMTGRHFPDDIPRTGKYKSYKRCHVCYQNKKNKQTSYKCTDCNDIPLCATPCFKIYHTTKKY